MGARKRKVYFRWLALLAATALALYVCWLMLLPFVNVLAWAAALVILFHPIHQRLAALTGRPDELLIFFSVLGGLRIWGALGLALGPVVIAVTLALLDVFRQMDTGAKRMTEQTEKTE